MIIRDHRAEFEGAKRWQENATVFLLCVAMFLGLGAGWSIGDELQQCRLAAEAVPSAPVLR